MSKVIGFGGISMIGNRMSRLTPISNRPKRRLFVKFVNSDIALEVYLSTKIPQEYNIFFCLFFIRVLK
ncbi:MAG: hypothetical protein LBI18_10930 [Planctomycetaceae bacterium]|nr:hypothetical protein [Planctomycetaceae bacterium]